ncbi:hypothetical protein SNE40_010058 [Patella caerulea]|uniref:Uncharacterized protein n=1 Tax=Patella caerulea TaxID=87958 RepID=A0AAN8JUI1_PATCE
MKVLVFLAVFIATVACESCVQDGDCKSLSCVTFATTKCIKNICTCTRKCDTITEKCHSKEHCQHEFQEDNCQCSTGLHCIDGYCHCGFPAASTLPPVVTTAPTTQAPTTQAPTTQAPTQTTTTQAPTQTQSSTTQAPTQPPTTQTPTPTPAPAQTPTPSQ